MDFRTLVLNIQQHVPDLSTIVIKQRVNMRYQNILRMRSWEFLNDDMMLGTERYYNTASNCSAWYGGNRVRITTTSGVSISPSNIGWMFRFGSESQYYEISGCTAGVASGQTFSLLNSYSGNSNGLSGSSFTLFKNSYVLSSSGHSVLDIRSIVYDQPIREVPLSWMNRHDPERTSTGQPEKYTIVEQYRSRGWIRVQFWPATAAGPYGVRVYYRKSISDLSADTDQPICSPDLLEAWALYDCYKIAAIKNPVYLQLAREQRTDQRIALADAIEDDQQLASLPNKIKDRSGGYGVNDDYALDHDVDYLGDFYR